MNIIEVINSLRENADDFFACGEVESSKITQAEEILGVGFAEEFVESAYNLEICIISKT